MKIAGCFSRELKNSPEIVRNMAQAQRLFEGQRFITHSLTDGALAQIAASERFSSINLARHGETGNILLLSGTPLKIGKSLEGELDRAVSLDYKEATKILRELDGAFGAFFWDAQNRKLAVVTDALGLQPVYMHRRKDLLLLATEMKAFPASGLVGVEMDPAGWGSFISLGYHIGNSTQLAGVTRCGPASIMVYDPADDKLESHTYWSWPPVQPDMTLEQVDLDGMIDSMRAEIIACRQHSEMGTLLLSGGFDSRITISMLCREGLNPNALILAHQDELWGADSKLAVRAAEALGVSYRCVKPSRDYYNTPSYLDYLVMNEVSTPSLYLFIAQVSSYLHPDMQVIWDGTPPGYAYVPAFLPPGGFNVFLNAVCRTREDFGWQIASALFGRKRADDMYEAFSKLLKEVIAQYPDNEAGIAQFEALHRMRARTAHNALKVYANFALPCMLGVSRNFWQVAAAVPYAASKDYRLYFELFRRQNPRLVSIPFLTGGRIFCDHSCGWKGKLYDRGYRIAVSSLFGKARKAYRRFMRGSNKYWKECRYLPLTRNRMNMDHPDIDPDGLKRLDDRRHLPFYWQMWRWVMEGQLSTWNTHTFGDRIDTD